MPERSCIVCSKKDTKENLIRLSLFNNELLFDISKKMPGRGYYSCYDLKCIHKISTKKKKIKEMFSLDVDANLKRLKESFEKQVLKMINIAFLNKDVVIGLNDTLKDMNSLECIIAASDISESSLKKLKSRISDEKVLNCFDIDKLALGKQVAKSYVVVIGVKNIKDLNFKRVLSQYKILFSQE